MNDIDFGNLAYRAIMTAVQDHGHNFTCEAEDIANVAKALQTGQHDHLGTWQAHGHFFYTYALTHEDKYSDYLLRHGIYISRFGTSITTGFSLGSVGSWSRNYIYYSFNPEYVGQVHYESAHCLGNNDVSPTHDKFAHYNSACHCCFLNHNHTENQHNFYVKTNGG